MKKLFLTFVPLFFLFTIGCQENSLTEPLTSEVAEKENFQEDTYLHGIMKLDGMLADPSRPLNSWLEIGGEIEYEHRIIYLDPDQTASQYYYVPVERGDDGIILTEYFLERFARKYDKPGLKIGQKTLDVLRVHQWPGNIRELQHAIEHAVIMCEKNILSPGDFNLRLDKSPGQPSLNLEEVEKRTIEEALRKHQGRLNETFKELGISRTTLYHKMKKYGLQ